MAFRDFKDLTRRTASDKTWLNKVCLTSRVYKFFDKKASGGTIMKLCLIMN